MMMVLDSTTDVVNWGSDSEKLMLNILKTPHQTASTAVHSSILRSVNWNLRGFGLSVICLGFHQIVNQPHHMIGNFNPVRVPPTT